MTIASRAEIPSPNVMLVAEMHVPGIELGSLRNCKSARAYVAGKPSADERMYGWGGGLAIASLWAPSLTGRSE